MKIGLYHEAAGVRDTGGIARFVQEIGAALAGDHEVYLYTGPGELTDTVADSEIRVRRIPALPGQETVTEAFAGATPLGSQTLDKACAFAVAWGTGLVDHVNRTLDVLFVHQYVDDLLLSRVVDVPTVYEYHGLQSVGAGARARERLSATDRVVANSAFTARSVRESFDREVDGIVGPGVDVDLFSPRSGGPPDGSGSTADVASADGGIAPTETAGAAGSAVEADDSDRPLVLSVGRLVPAKGVYDLLTAASRTDAEPRLRIVGRGDEGAVRDAAADLGIGDAVEVLGGVEHDDLPAHYRAADVFCNPSHYESFGMVNVEAMACGTPVVTTATGGITEYASHEENALLVPPARPDRLAAALDEALGDRELRERLGAAGRETAEGYAWKRQADAAERVFERVCAGD